MKNIILAITCLFLLGCNAIEAVFDKSHEHKAYTQEAKIALKKIHQASTQYWIGNGEAPSDTMELEDYGYLDLKYLEGRWTFELNIENDYYNGLEGTIIAYSLEEMELGSGHTVIYDIRTGKFSGSLIPEQEVDDDEAAEPETTSDATAE